MTVESRQMPVVEEAEALRGVWSPITVADLKFVRLSRSSASGPDGISARLFLHQF